MCYTPFDRLIKLCNKEALHYNESNSFNYCSFCINMVGSFYSFYAYK